MLTYNKNKKAINASNFTIGILQNEITIVKCANDNFKLNIYGLNLKIRLKVEERHER